jgi:hypothetical protein
MKYPPLEVKDSEPFPDLELVIVTNYSCPKCGYNTQLRMDIVPLDVLERKYLNERRGDKHFSTLFNQGVGGGVCDCGTDLDHTTTIEPATMIDLARLYANVSSISYHNGTFNHYVYTKWIKHDCKILTSEEPLAIPSLEEMYHCLDEHYRKERGELTLMHEGAMKQLKAILEKWEGFNP